MIPNKDVVCEHWAVIACDQYTSDEKYWGSVAELVKDKKSTYHLMLPEIYLEDDGVEDKIKEIHKNMNDYLDGNVFESVDGLIFVKRKLRCGKNRLGLVFSIDLENYSYDKNSQSLIRPTEGTIVERIPPRKKVRNGARIESPHVMLIFDDDKKEIIEPIAERLDTYQKLYDFNLMFDSGKIEGYLINKNDEIKDILGSFEKFLDDEYFKNKYGDKGEPILFCVGDGNHSLATAKSYWEDVKRDLNDEEIKNHPARFALVEAVNLYDESLEFEAIYRVLFGVDSALLEETLREHLDREELDFEISEIDSFDEMKKIVDEENTSNKHVFGFLTNNKYKVIKINNPKLNLSFATLQEFLDAFIEKNNVKIDYIHGEDLLQELACKENNTGFYLKSIQKEDLFKSVIKDGPLPRKTFSMGHAYDKRFYLECRKIN